MLSTLAAGAFSNSHLVGVEQSACHALQYLQVKAGYVLSHTVGDQASANTRLISTTIGVPVTLAVVRSAAATTVSSCCVPIKHYLAAQRVKSKGRVEYVKDTCLAGAQYLAWPCCFDGIIASYRQSRKREEVPQLKTKSTNLVLNKPYYIPSDDRWFVNLRGEAAPYEVLPQSMNAAGEMTWTFAPITRENKPLAIPNEKVVKRTPMMLQLKPKIDFSIYSGVLIIVERSPSGAHPVGIGFRTGRYEFVTPFHMFSKEKVDYDIVSPEQYDTHLEDEMSKCVFMDSRGDPRSRTGHDQITISTAEVVFCQVGVPGYKQGLSFGLKGVVRALGFALQCAQEWKPLVESFGEICDSPSFTALTGAIFHNLNTEAGWSGSPLFREESGGHKITAMHIAAGPPGVPLNIAVSGPSLQKQMLLQEHSQFAMNCPFLQGKGLTLSTVSTRRAHERRCSPRLKQRLGGCTKSLRRYLTPRSKTETQQEEWRRRQTRT